MELPRAPTSSAAASHAKTSATPGSKSVSMGQDLGSGRNLPASFAFYDLDSSSWRTSQRSLFEVSTVFSGIWPRSGSMRSGKAFERQMSARPTDVSGCLSWPTPTARDGDPVRGTPSAATAAKRFAAGRRNLDDAVALWPMPTASDSKGPGPTGRRAPTDDNLPTRVTRLWPTPTASDANSSGAAGYSTESGRHSGTTLTDATVRIVSRRAPPRSPNGMVLNPRFVEAMMGFQDGHTACDFSAMPSSRSKPR
jgi:hypothetical protein